MGGGEFEIKAFFTVFPSAQALGERDTLSFG
jgi:hypothetical protein